MAATTVSIEELRRVADEVGEAPDNGPVYVTRPGKLPLVLLTVNEYRKLSGRQESIVDLPTKSEGHDLEFDSSRMTIEGYRKLTGKLPGILDLLAYPGAGEIEFEPPRMGTGPYRPTDDLFD